MEEFVSIIIPVYNREKYITECIKSLTSQDYKKLEIIVIDDGSTDNTLKISEALAQQDDRIKILSLNHVGVSNARNHGVEIATGEYILFVDSDDVIHPQTISSLVKEIKIHNCAMATIKGKDIKEENWKSEIFKEFLTPKKFDNICVYSNLDAINYSFKERDILQRAGGVMLRADYIGTTRFDTSLHLGEDVWFLYQNLIKGTSIVVLKEKCYYWRWHPTKVTRDLSAAAFLSRLQAKELLWKSEDSFGRYENGNIEKVRTFELFIKQLTRTDPSCEDSKIIIKTIKQYKKVLLPALKIRQKLQLYLGLYLPNIYFPLLKSHLKRIKKNKKS